MTKKMEVWVGIGSNLGDSVTLCRQAIRALQLLFPEEFVSSSLYYTSPVGEGIDGLFVNAVCRVYTDLPPRKVLEALQTIERDLGKTPKLPGTGNRKIDLDLLLYGDESVQEKGLQVPHPKWADRLFVLIPMQEVTPSILWKGKHMCLAERIAALKYMTKESICINN